MNEVEINKAQSELKNCTVNVETTHEKNSWKIKEAKKVIYGESCGKLVE